MFDPHVSQSGLFSRRRSALQFPAAPLPPTQLPAPVSAEPPSDAAPPVGDMRLVAEPCFWLFVGTGALLLAGWVLAPVYRDYQTAAAENDRARLQVARLEVRNRQYQELLEAIEKDPQFVAGMLRGRLNTPAGRNPTAVISDEAPEHRLPEPGAAAVLAQFERVPGPRPIRFAALERWAKMFSDPARRPVLLAIAIGCLTIAFVFFAPRRATATQLRTD